jgi:hypothetical protein
MYSLRRTSPIRAFLCQSVSGIHIGVGLILMALAVCVAAVDPLSNDATSVSMLTIDPRTSPLLTNNTGDTNTSAVSGIHLLPSFHTLTISYLLPERLPLPLPLRQIRKPNHVIRRCCRRPKYNMRLLRSQHFRSNPICNCYRSKYARLHCGYLFRSESI